MDKPWYLSEYNEKTYLHNKTLVIKSFQGSTQADHRHCELCWATISQHSCDHQYGYYEKSSKSWICPDCYKEFADLFKWTASGNLKP